MVGICGHKEVVVMETVEVGTCSNKEVVWNNVVVVLHDMVVCDSKVVVHDLVVLGVGSNCLVVLHNKAFHYQKQHCLQVCKMLLHRWVEANASTQMRFPFSLNLCIPILSPLKSVS
jgi:hypothetical protein